MQHGVVGAKRLQPSKVGGADAPSVLDLYGVEASLSVDDEVDLGAGLGPPKMQGRSGWRVGGTAEARITARDQVSSIGTARSATLADGL